MRDGGQIALDWCFVGESNGAEGPPDCDVIVLLLPGITGKSGNAYIVRFAQFLHSLRGSRWRVVVKSWRGIGCPLSASQPRAESWDSHAVQDTVEAAEHIRRQHPHARLVCMGFSHGGNVCLGALAHDPHLFEAGVMLSAPYDYKATMAHLEKDQWFPYAFVNTKALSEEYDKVGATPLIAADLPEGAKGFEAIDRIVRYRNLATHLLVRRPYGSTWHEFITRRYTGHDTAPDYYSSVTDMVQEAIAEIRTPVLCLLSEDDPVTPPSTFKRYIYGEHPAASKPCSTSPWVAFSLTKRGGHCGWFYSVCGLSWLDEVALEFLEASLDY